MAKKRLTPRSKVVLTAFDSAQRVVLEQTLSYFDYYEELHPLIDENEFRRERMIRRLCGRIYDSKGRLTKEFENWFDLQGALIGGIAIHDDGTFVIY